MNFAINGGPAVTAFNYNAQEMIFTWRRLYVRPRLAGLRVLLTRRRGRWLLGARIGERELRLRADESFGVPQQ